MEFISSANLEIFTQLIIATLLGVTLGAERIIAHKTAGMRTYGLVSLGSTLFVVIGNIVVQNNAGNLALNPLQMASQVIMGIGFLSAGMIIFRDSKISGLTTAVGLWISAGIGIAVGFKLYTIAIFTTLLTLFVFTILWLIEKKMKNILKIEE